MKASFKTIGCRLNQFETDSLITQFKNAGIEITDFKSPANVCVINTCTVTNKSDYKSRNAIRKAIKISPDALIVVTGCYAQTNSDIIKSIHGVDYVIDNERKYAILEIVLKNMKSADISLLKGNVFAFPAPIKGIHTRAYLKIQDGCDNYCSYCKVAYARGKEKSRDLQSIISEFKTIVKSGIKEIVLTGVNTGNHEASIENVINALMKISGDFRIHISSIEFAHVTDAFLELFKMPKICYHLHIPLQSGSDKILKIMNRNYTKKQYLNLIEKTLKMLPHINLTTDVIVGFPNETWEDFEDTLEVIKKARFSHIHTFRYSPRKGTKAYSLNCQGNKKESKRKSEMIHEISAQQSTKYKNALIGKPLRVLTENIVDFQGQIYTKGKSNEYADVYIAHRVKKSVFVECIGSEIINGKLVALFS